MSEYCNDLFELWELLEEMSAELEVCPLWSCREENECLALHKETVDAGLGSKHGREIWMDLQNIILLHDHALVFWISALVGHLSASQYQTL